MAEGPDLDELLPSLSTENLPGFGEEAEQVPEEFIKVDLGKKRAIVDYLFPPDQQMSNWPLPSPREYVEYFLESSSAKFKEVEIESLIIGVEKFVKYFNKNRDKYSRNRDRMQFLEENLAVYVKPAAEETGKRGRPRKQFETLCEERKRRKSGEAVKEFMKSVPKIPEVDILRQMIQRSSLNFKNNLLKILDFCLDEEHNSNKIIGFIKAGEVKPYSEALGLLLHLGLTKSAYCELRVGAKIRNANLYPAYFKIQNEKKKLRPPIDKIVVTETAASVSLQCLLYHTVERILDLQESVIDQVFDKSLNKTLKLYVSWGFDGSTGQSNFKQKFASGIINPYMDSSLLATTMIPLRLVHISTEIIIWQNPCAHSVRFCRPIDIRFVKETKEVILERFSSIQHEIQHLQPFQCSKSSAEVVFDLSLTIIDGKVLSVITGTSSYQACPLCKCTPEMFNSFPNLTSGVFAVTSTENFKYGINPLHAEIRCLENLLNISKRLDFKEWFTTGDERKMLYKNRQSEIQRNLFTRLGLRVDFPSPTCAGTSNDGNTARRAFANFQEFAEVLQINVELVRRLRNILITINQHLEINADLFGEYCMETFKLYCELYPWYPMSATLHKILVHGKDLINQSVLPIGLYSEQAGESRHRIFKLDRLHHARRNSRINTLTDVFCRALETSDPVVSTLSIKSVHRCKAQLPSEVVALLKCPEVVDHEEIDISQNQDYSEITLHGKEFPDIVLEYENEEE